MSETVCKFKPPPEKPRDFDFEKALKLLSTISISVGIVIHSFCLGFFHRFEIPAYPSFTASMQFYLASVLKNTHETLNLAWKLPIFFLLLYLALEAWERKKCWQKVLLTAIGVTAIATLLYYMKELWLFAPPVFSLTSGLRLYSSTLDGKLGKAKKARNILIHGFVVIVCSTGAFQVLDLAHFRSRPINASFPNGFGIQSYEPSNLLWVESSKRYWSYCKDSGGVIYGTDDHEKIFVRTEMSIPLYEFFCVPSKQ